MKKYYMSEKGGGPNPRDPPPSGSAPPVHTARCVRRAGESNTNMQRRRHHMTYTVFSCLA